MNSKGQLEAGIIIGIILATLAFIAPAAYMCISQGECQVIQYAVEVVYE